ncbi:MAG: acyl-CoA dehydrogenase family protein [Saprospiraceae bacterium]
METLTTATSIDEFRAETRAWLEENCPASMRLPASSNDDLYMGGKKTKFSSDDQRLWFERMLERGWTAPTWPTEYGGGGLNKQQAKVLKEELRAISARPALWSFGLSMLGPALLKFGTEQQKEEHLTKIISGEVWWCQGYSEPGAGSDLAGLQTRCEDMGDHYIVNGQKVWTSYADRADWIFCLVRTDPEAPKHSGISFILIDMDQEGVSTAPIKLISGKSPFCETFFDNARAEKHNVIGKENTGWTTAKYLLTHERSMIGDLFGQADRKPLSQTAIEGIGLENGKLADPILRVKTARMMIEQAALGWSVERIMDEAKAGQPIGAKSSFFKLVGTEFNKDKYELLLELAGTEGVEWGDDYKDGKLARDMCRTKGNSIEGGTSEVQLNIIAKRILGLPGK